MARTRAGEPDDEGEGYDEYDAEFDYDPDDLHARTLDLYAMLIATGLDPARSTVYAQSHVRAHAEASWLLGAVTGYGQLGRMTQFKEKGEQQEFVSSALFNYPAKVTDACDKEVFYIVGGGAVQRTNGSRRLDSGHRCLGT